MRHPAQQLQVRGNDVGQVLSREHVMLSERARQLRRKDEGSVYPASHPHRHDQLGLQPVLSKGTGQLAPKGAGKRVSSH